MGQTACDIHVNEYPETQREEKQSHKLQLIRLYCRVWEKALAQ